LPPPGTLRVLKQFICMMQSSSTILKQFGEAIRTTYAWIVSDPLPVRWANLINQLNAEEDALNERTRRHSGRYPG
jgi:hypothetical protein